MQFWCASFCCGYIIIFSEGIGLISPYRSGLLHWHWRNRMRASAGSTIISPNSQLFGEIWGFVALISLKWKCRLFDEINVTAWLYWRLPIDKISVQPEKRISLKWRTFTFRWWPPWCRGSWNKDKSSIKTWSSKPIMTLSNGLYFPRYWPFVRGIHRWPVNSPRKGPVTRSFDVFFDLRIEKRLVNNREAGDLRRNRAHYDVIVMK